MKKIILFLSITILIICSLLYIRYNNEHMIEQCINTNDENYISICLEFHGFDKNNVKGFQQNYDVFFNHSLFNFKDKKIQYNFVNQYLINLSDCKEVEGCKLRDEGKGYYIVLNNCLNNSNCIDQLIGKNNKNCLESLNDSIKEMPIKFQNLISVDKNKMCEVYNKENHQDILSIIN